MINYHFVKHSLHLHNQPNQFSTYFSLRLPLDLCLGRSSRLSRSTVARVSRLSFLLVLLMRRLALLIVVMTLPLFVVLLTMMILYGRSMEHNVRLLAILCCFVVLRWLDEILIFIGTNVAGL